MKDFVIVTDSTSDLPGKLREENNIDYCKMHIVVDYDSAEPKELEASLDWEKYSPKEFYDWLRNGRKVKTTAVPVEEFLRVFSKHFVEGKDILYIACSSALSASGNMANTVVREELAEKYPDSKLVVVDSLNSCMGQGSMVIKAAQLKKEGKSLEEIVAWLEENKLKFNQLATVETLTYLKAAGRVTASSAFFGNIFGVKPIIISDAKGHNVAFKKIKGRKAALAELVSSMKEVGEDLDNQVVYVAHADCEADADFLKEEILKVCNPIAVEKAYIGPIVGTSTGPGTIAIYCYGKEVEFVGE